MVVITDKRTELMEMCSKQGYLLLEDGEEIYSHKQSVSRVLSDLVEGGLMEKKDAPESSTKDYVWELTEKGKIFVS